MLLTFIVYNIFYLCNLPENSSFKYLTKEDNNIFFHLKSKVIISTNNAIMDHDYYNKHQIPTNDYGNVLR